VRTGAAAVEAMVVVVEVAAEAMVVAAAVAIKQRTNALPTVGKGVHVSGRHVSFFHEQLWPGWRDLALCIAA
jgi:hypothetical protein